MSEIKLSYSKRIEKITDSIREISDIIRECHDMIDQCSEILKSKTDDPLST